MFDGLTREVVSRPLPKETDCLFGKSRDWLILGLLLLSHLLFLWAFQPPINQNLYISGIALGVSFSQPILFALWAALASSRFYHRFCWSLFLCILVFFIDELLILQSLSPRELSRQTPGRSMILMMAFYFLYTVIFHLIRRISGWQIQRAGQVPGNDGYQPGQFGIGHLLILTAITAIALSLAQTLPIMFPQTRGSSYPIGVYLRIIGCTLILPFPAIVLPWFALSLRVRPMSLFVWIVFGGLIDLFLVVIFPLPPPGMFSNPAMIAFDLFVQIGVGLSVVLTTLPLRLCGYRIIRVRKRETEEREKPHAG